MSPRALPDQRRERATHAQTPTTLVQGRPADQRTPRRGTHRRLRGRNPVTGLSLQGDLVISPLPWIQESPIEKFRRGSELDHASAAGLLNRGHLSSRHGSKLPAVFELDDNMARVNTAYVSAKRAAGSQDNSRARLVVDERS